MIRHILLPVFALLGVLFWASTGYAQQPVAPCTTVNTYVCTPVSAANPLPMTVAPGGATSTMTGPTIATGNTFQSLAAANTARKSCFIQNTSTHTLYVFFGATGSATTSNSAQVAPGGTISCANVNGTVITDNIAVTTSTTADTLVLNLN